MKSTKRMLAAAGLAVTLLFGGVTGASADLIPSSWSVAAGTVGYTPTSPFLYDIKGPLYGPPVTTVPDNTLVEASLNIQPESEASRGAAYAFVDPLGFNNSSVGARSQVLTGGFASEPECGCLDIANTSAAALGARVPNPLGGGATADLTLHIDGTLTLLKRADDSGFLQVCNPDDPETCLDTGISTTSASVFVSLALGDPTSNVEETLEIFDSSIPDGEIAFGVATLLWVPDEVTGVSRAKLFTFGLFDDATFTELGDESGGPCTANFCQMSVHLTLTIPSEVLLGFGDELDIGLLLATDAYIAESAAGREAEADFFNTASVSLVFLPLAVPAPGSLFLLGLGLLGMAAARRRRGLH